MTITVRKMKNNTNLSNNYGEDRNYEGIIRNSRSLVLIVRNFVAFEKGKEILNFHKYIIMIQLTPFLPFEPKPSNCIYFICQVTDVHVLLFTCLFYI